MRSREAATGLRPIGLTLATCNRCSLLQLVQDVDAIEVYSDYLYHSSVTVGLASYYARLSHSLIAELAIGKGSLIVDVGSNDGSGLVPFRDAGMRVAGIEPSNGPAHAAIARGLPTVNSFLNDESVGAVRATHGSASLVSANYVAANVPDPVGFLRLMRSLLAPGGAISIVTGYHPDQFAVNMFEYVNHDHLTYMAVNSAARLADLAGLRLVSARRVEHKGGSVHLLLRPQEANAAADESVAQLQQREAWMGIDSHAYFAETSGRVEAAGAAVRSLLQQWGGTRIAGVGASISTTHLLHQFSIGHLIARLFDDDPNKLGRYSPGFGIEVSQLDDLGRGDWDVAVLLAWQHSTKLLTRIRETGFRGKVLVPLPHPELVDVV
jgi:SAM-dependent methyltransferase